VNVVEMLGGQRHRQYDAVCDVVFEQHNYWLEDKIQAELVIHYVQLHMHHPPMFVIAGALGK
jgi:hypothetical protein